MKNKKDRKQENFTKKKINDIYNRNQMYEIKKKKNGK